MKKDILIAALVVFAIGIWLTAVGTMAYIAIHFIEKFW